MISVAIRANDEHSGPRDYGGMSETDEPDWHLREWLTFLGKKQSSMVTELGWDKARANYVWHGKIPYRRDVVNQVSAWLMIQPFELLLPPSEAMALRRLRQAAKVIAEDPAYPIAAEDGRTFESVIKPKAVA